MTLKFLLEKISKLAIDERIINSAMAGSSIAQVNPKTVDSYPLLFSAPTGQHLVSENYTTYEISLFYLDRLLDDNSNDIDIYSASIEELKNLVRKIETIEGVYKVGDDWRVQNYSDTESFNDRLAGSFCTIDIVTVNNCVCPVD